VTDGFAKNNDDGTAQLLVYRAAALREKGIFEAALEILREALRSKKRNEIVLASARYERGLVYEASGKKGRARQEWERLYAQDAHYRDVAQRLGLTANQSFAPPRSHA
jgi:tetratricopeptide (TPR) repeat protein